MKVLLVLTACSLFIGAYAASVADIYYGPIYDLDDEMIFVDDSKVISAEDNSHEDSKESSEETVNRNSLESAFGRTHRFSCDVLSFQSKWTSPNHWACAIRCFAQRRKGGRCENGICKCRGKKWGR